MIPHYLRRDYKQKTRLSARMIGFILGYGYFAIFLALGMFAGFLFINILTARAQSVLVSDNLRVEQVQNECERVLRELDNGL